MTSAFSGADVRRGTRQTTRTRRAPLHRQPLRKASHGGLGSRSRPSEGAWGGGARLQAWVRPGPAVPHRCSGLTVRTRPVPCRPVPVAAGGRSPAPEPGGSPATRPPAVRPAPPPPAARGAPTSARRRYCFFGPAGGGGAGLPPVAAGNPARLREDAARRRRAGAGTAESGKAASGQSRSARQPPKRGATGGAGRSLHPPPGPALRAHPAALGASGARAGRPPFPIAAARGRSPAPPGVRGSLPGGTKGAFTCALPAPEEEGEGGRRAPLNCGPSRSCSAPSARFSLHCSFPTRRSRSLSKS